MISVFELAAGVFVSALWNSGSLIAAVGKQLLQERIPSRTEWQKKQDARPVAILDIGGGERWRGANKPSVIYKKVGASWPLIFLPASKPCGIDTGPPFFQALLTLWLIDDGCGGGWLRVRLAHGNST